MQQFLLGESLRVPFNETVQMQTYPSQGIRSISVAPQEIIRGTDIVALLAIGFVNLSGKPEKQRRGPGI